MSQKGKIKRHSAVPLLKSEIGLEAAPRLGWKDVVVYFAAKYPEPLWHHSDTGFVPTLYASVPLS